MASPPSFPSGSILSILLPKRLPFLHPACPLHCPQILSAIRCPLCCDHSRLFWPLPLYSANTFPPRSLIHVLWDSLFEQTLLSTCWVPALAEIYVNIIRFMLYVWHVREMEMEVALFRLQKQASDWLWPCLDYVPACKHTSSTLGKKGGRSWRFLSPWRPGQPPNIEEVLWSTRWNKKHCKSYRKTRAACLCTNWWCYQSVAWDYNRERPELTCGVDAPPDTFFPLRLQIAFTWNFQVKALFKSECGFRLSLVMYMLLAFSIVSISFLLMTVHEIKSNNPLLNIKIVYCVCNEWSLLLMNPSNLKWK